MTLWREVLASLGDDSRDDTEREAIAARGAADVSSAAGTPTRPAPHSAPWTARARRGRRDGRPGAPAGRTTSGRSSPAAAVPFADRTVPARSPPHPHTCQDRPRSDRTPPQSAKARAARGGPGPCSRGPRTGHGKLTRPRRRTGIEAADCTGPRRGFNQFARAAYGKDGCPYRALRANSLQYDICHRMDLSCPRYATTVEIHAACPRDTTSLTSPHLLILIFHTRWTAITVSAGGPSSHPTVATNCVEHANRQHPGRPKALRPRPRPGTTVHSDIGRGRHRPAGSRRRGSVPSVRRRRGVSQVQIGIPDRGERLCRRQVVPGVR